MTRTVMHTNQPPERDELWAEGFWVGQRGVRTFASSNPGFLVFYLVFFTAVFGVVLSQEIPAWYAFPLGSLPAAGLTGILTFLFSRGWLGNAPDGD